MQRQVSTYWKDGYIYLFFVILISTVAWVFYNVQDPTPRDQSTNGIVDLRNYHFKESGLVNLSGEWFFEPNQFTDPTQSIDPNREKNEFLRLPGSWNKSQLLNNRGCATFRLKMVLPVGERNWGIWSTGMIMAGEVFVDGQSLIKLGHPSCDPNQNRPVQKPYAVYFHSLKSEVELVVQVSNDDYALGGAVQTILFGPQDQIKKRDELHVTFYLCSLLLMLIFSFMLWVISRALPSDRFFILMSIYMFLFVIITLTHWERMIYDLFPGLPFEAMIRMKNGALYGSLFLYGLFSMRLYPGQKFVFFKGLTWLVGLTVIPAIGLNFWYFSHLEPIILLYLLFFELVLSLIMFMNYAKGNYGLLGKIGSRYYQLATFCLINISYLTLMGSLNIIADRIMIYIFLMLFGVFLMLMLAEIYRMKHRTNVTLTAKVLQTNEQKELFYQLTQTALDQPILRMNEYIQNVFKNSMPNGNVSGKDQLYVSMMSQRMLRLINDILEHVENPQFKLDLISEIDLRGTLEDVYLQWSDEFLRKQVYFDYDGISAEHQIVGDPNIFEKFVYHLIGHGLGALRNGEMQVRYDEEKALLSFVIRADSIQAIQSPTIHDLLARMAVQKMKAKWLEMTSGAHSQMSLQVQFQLPKMMPMVEKKMDGAFDELPQSGLDLLIISRDETLTRQLLDELEQCYLLRISDDWQEAKEWIDHDRPNIILLDRLIDGQNGLEICAEIRERFSIVELPILFLTKTNSKPLTNLFLAAGGNGQIMLPTTMRLIQEEINRARKMQELANLSQEREMQFLQSQIKPHFLYNTLNAIISFSYVDQNKSKQMLRLLSDYMNLIFKNESSEQLIPLSAEKALIETFVEISSLRMEKPIELRFDVDAELMNVLVMPFLIQPVVENAIIHGISKQKENGLVEVFIQKQDDLMKITVRDNGAGMVESQMRRLLDEKEASTGGIGLSNLQARLQYKTGKRLSIMSKPGFHTEISYYFPVYKN